MAISARTTWALAVLLVGFEPCRAGDALSKEELAKLGKASTALLVVKPAAASGSAFCVHASGLFVTNEHVVRGNGAIELVLDPGLKTQKVLAGKIVRADKELDLALIRVEGAKDLVALPLGSDEKLNELAEVIAFGFPFGTELSLDKKEYPTVSVNAGTITALRRKDGALQRIQVDAALNPGNSGGPVLDRNGKVIGVVVAGIRGSGVNSVIPVSHVTRFVARPDFQAILPPLAAANMHKAALFQVKAAFLIPGDKPAELELVLKGADGKERKHKMELADGVYRVTAVPVPLPEGPQKLRVTVVFSDGSVTGSATDVDFKVGAKVMKLSEARRIRMKPAQVRLDDGKTVDGALTGFDTLRMRLGGPELVLTLTDAVEVQCEAPATEDSVSYTIIATQSGKEVGRLADTIGITGLTRSDVPTGDSGRVGIKPPVHADNQVVMTLPGAVSEVCAGGGGRYLILHFPKLRKLGVFDCTQAKIVKYLAVPEDTIQFTAGLDKLFVFLPDSNLLQRWDLTSFEKELTVTAPMAIERLAMGSATREPLIVQHAGDFVLLDSKTLKKSSLRIAEGGVNYPDRDATLRVSANGKVVTGRRVLLRVGETYRPVDAPGDVLPSPEGRVLYGRNQLYTAEGKPLGKSFGGYGQSLWIAPPVQGPFAVFYKEVGGAKKVQPGISLVGETRPLVNLPEIEGIADLVDWQAGRSMPIEQHLFLIADAQLLVFIPATNDKLVLYRVDVEQLLNKADVDYLYVKSLPETTFAPGSDYKYQLVVRSRKGGVKYKLDAGPDNMRLSADGLLTWKVPTDFADKNVNVIITISDLSGQEVFHTFTARSLEKAERAPD